MDKKPSYPCDDDAILYRDGDDIHIYRDGPVRLGCFHKTGGWTKDGLWICTDCVYALVPRELLIEWKAAMTKALSDLQIYRDVLEKKHA
jgi:hypothetical protein